MKLKHSNGKTSNLSSETTPRRLRKKKWQKQPKDLNQDIPGQATRLVHLCASATMQSSIALENLLGNAWKYSARKPLTHIEFGALAQNPPASEKPVPGGPSAPPQVEFFLRDNGAGFDMALVDKLFAPFQRLHPQEDYSGTGIGLSIVKRIINRHSGRIWAEGKVGEGAVFTFTLGANPSGSVIK